MTKICSKCREEKPLDDFHNGAKWRDGKYPSCKTCRRDFTVANSAKIQCYQKNYKTENAARLKLHYQAVREHQLTKHDEYYQTVRGRAVRLRNSAKKSPDGCSLTLEHVIRGIETGFCPVTGIPFDLRTNEKARTGRQTNPFAPSLDRLDPNKGYTDENTRVVVWHYNAMKGELSDREVLNICEAVIARARRAA